LDKFIHEITLFFSELVSSNLKKQFEEAVKVFVKPLEKIGITPNILTIMGVVIAVMTAYGYTLVPVNKAYLVYSGLMIVLSGFIDAIDGVLARSTGKVTRFGGLFDSVSDRYSDAIIFTGIIIARLCNELIGIIALFSSMLVSYARARAEMEGVKMAGIGLAERAERLTFLSLCSIVAYWWTPAINYGVIILAVLAQITIIQRILYYKKEIEKN
jgi:archaetidylinositol phosphate synthase